MFKIIPCHNKIPLIKDWSNEASNDSEKIRLWQELYKEKLNYFGIPTGPVNDILVLDIDVKNNGFESIKKFNLEIPKTMSQRTLSGGMHYVFRYPKDGRQYGNRVGIYPGVDVRGVGGHICHYGLDNSFIADAPQWLLELANKPTIQATGSVIQLAPSIAESVILEALQAIREAPPGESNNTLNLQAFKVGQLVTSGSITKEYAEQILLRAALERGKPEREAKATIASGLNGGNNKPLTSPFGAPQPTITIPEAPKIERWTPKEFTLQDLLNVKNLKKPQLFRDWSTEDIHLTTADGGTGKTTLKLFEAVCLALGERFLGFECLQPGKTLFITGEDTAGKLGAMIGKICESMGLYNQTDKLNTVMRSIVVKKDVDLCLISKDKQGFLYPNLVALNKVLEAVIDIKPKMIVFDPISSFWGSEAALNDMAKAVAKFMGALVEESKACVEIINHMGKASSNSKDMSQFAGRGGTGLPSHARVVRVLRSIDGEEYLDLTGQVLDEEKQAMVCNVSKFSDGSPLYNKQFLIVRDGYLFSRIAIEGQKQRELDKQSSDCERIFKFIKEARKNNKTITRSTVISVFMSAGDPISEARVKRAVELIQFQGYEGEFIKYAQHPDITKKEQMIVLCDDQEKEI